MPTKTDSETDTHLIHIGSPKTSTTSLQVHLAEVWKNDEHPIFPIGMMNNKGPFSVTDKIHQLITHDIAMRDIQWRAGFDELKNHINQIVAEKPKNRRLLISSELISQTLAGPACLKTRFTRLRDLFGPNCEIVLTIREQKKAIESYYSTLVRAFGLSIPYDYFLFYSSEFPNWDKNPIPSFDFWGIYKEALSVFDKVTVLIFEELISSKENVTRSHGLFRSLFKIDFSSLQQVNEGLSIDKAHYLASFNSTLKNGFSEAAETPNLNIYAGPDRQIIKRAAKTPPLSMELSRIKDVKTSTIRQGKIFNNSLKYAELAKSFDLVNGPDEDEMKALETRISNVFRPGNNNLSQALGVDLNQYGYAV